jgi:CheY-like chemotaxis protein
MDAAALPAVREVLDLLAVVASGLEVARGQAALGASNRETLERAFEALHRVSERVRHLAAGGHGAPDDAAGLVAQAAPLAGADTPKAMVEGLAPPPVAPEASASPGEARARVGRVVILDDEEPLVRVGKHLLKRLGHEATGFIHPREAIEALDRDPRGFDVFITDLTMPEMSGYEVARAVAQIRPDLPIIVLSGKLHDDGDALAIPNPVYRLGKPYTRDQLQQVVEAALRGR